METETNVTLRLPGVLDTLAAAPLLQLISDRRGSDLRLDGSEVQRIGGQCLQVLLAAQAAWLADERALHIVEPSAELSQALSLLGADPELPLLQQEHCA